MKMDFFIVTFVDFKIIRGLKVFWKILRLKLFLEKSIVIYLESFYQNLIKKKFQPIKFLIGRKSWGYGV